MKNLKLKLLILVWLDMSLVNLKGLLALESPKSSALVNDFISDTTEDIIKESKRKSAIDMVNHLKMKTDSFLTSLRDEVPAESMAELEKGVKQRMEELILRLGFEEEFNCNGEKAVVEPAEIEKPASEIAAQFGGEPQQTTTESVDTTSNVTCFQDDMRLTGTDLPGSRIRETIRDTVLLCQEACRDDPDCQFFIYFSKKHYQPWKRRTCRLLRLQGEYQPASGHISGPQICPKSGSPGADADGAASSGGISGLGGKLRELFNTTLPEVLSIECERATKLPHKMEQLQRMLEVLVHHECDYLKVATKKEKFVAKLNMGMERVLASHNLLGTRAWPGVEPWLQPHLDTFNVHFQEACG